MWQIMWQYLTVYTNTSLGRKSVFKPITALTTRCDSDAGRDDIIKMIAVIHIPVPPCVQVGAVGCGAVASVELCGLPAARVARHSGVIPETFPVPGVAVATHLAVYRDAVSTPVGDGDWVVYSVLAVCRWEAGHPVHMYTVWKLYVHYQ